MTAHDQKSLLAPRMLHIFSGCLVQCSFKFFGAQVSSYIADPFEEVAAVHHQCIEYQGLSSGFTCSRHADAREHNLEVRKTGRTNEQRLDRNKGTVSKIAKA